MFAITFATVCILKVLMVSSADYKLLSEKKVTLNSPYNFSFLDFNGFLLMEITLKNISTSVTGVFLVTTMKSSLNTTDPDIAPERIKVDAEIKNAEVKILLQKNLINYRNILVDVELQTREGVCYASRLAEGRHVNSTGNWNYDEFSGSGSCLVPNPCEIIAKLENQCKENLKCSFDATKYICTFNKRNMQKSQSYNLYQTYDIADGLRTTVSFRQDYDYLNAADNFYKIHMIKKNWRDAKQECVKEGASLFYPENSDEAKAVLSFWILNQNTTQIKTWDPNVGPYVGISDIITEGTFETIDGKSISEVYNKWRRNEPNNYDDEDCVHMDLEGKYNDVSCDVKRSFICKRSLLSPEPHNLNRLRTTASFRQDYTYIDAANSFYKIQKIKKTWRDAKQECVKEGASLFYPENSDEANAVISFWKLNQNTNQTGTWVYVGISDIITEGAFETIDGRSISEVYDKWRRNEPNNYDDEDCVHMDQEGKYNDISCVEKYSFICKKSLLSLQEHNLGSVIPLDNTAVNTKLIIDLELFDNNTSVHVESSVHKRDILWSDKIILTEKDVVKEHIVTLIYSEETEVQFSCEEYKSRSKYLSVALVNTTEKKIQTFNKTVINNRKFEMADNRSILCCLYYAYHLMNDGKEVHITRFVVNKTLLSYQRKESMPLKPADAVTNDNTMIIISSVSVSTLALLVVVYVLKKRYQRETNLRETSQRPLPQIPRQNSFSEPVPNIPFYQNMLFRRECELEIQAREEPEYDEVMYQ